MSFHNIQTIIIYYVILISCFFLLFVGLIILCKQIVKYVYPHPHIGFCCEMLNFVKLRVVNFYTKSFLFYPFIFIALGIYLFLIYHFQIHYNFHLLNLFGLILTLMLIYRLYLDTIYTSILAVWERYRKYSNPRVRRKERRKNRKK